MANLNNVGRVTLVIAALFSALIMFSGGCSPSASSSYRFDNSPSSTNMSAVSNKNGENYRYGQGAGDGYGQLNDWNFNSRMGQKPQRKSQAGTASDSYMTQSEASTGKTFQHFNPGHPEADSEGFVTYTLPVRDGSGNGVASNDISRQDLLVQSNNESVIQNKVLGNNRLGNNSVSNYSNQSGVDNTDNRLAAGRNSRPKDSSSFTGWKPLDSSQSVNDSFPANRNYHAASSQQPVLSQDLSTNNLASKPVDIYQDSISNQSNSNRPLLQPVEITGIHYDQPRRNTSQPAIKSAYVSDRDSTPIVSGGGQTQQSREAVSYDFSEKQKVKEYGNRYATPRLNEDDSISSEIPQYTSKRDMQTNSILSTQPEKNKFSPPALNVGRIGINSDKQSSNTTIPAVAEYNRYMNPANVVSNTQELIFNLEEMLKKQPDNLELQMTLRYAYAAHGEHNKALQELSMVPLEKQKESMALARAAILGVKAHNSNDPMLANNALSAVKMLEEEIADQADLKISNFKICSSVEDFGRYQVLADNSLETGKAREVVIYCELENYKYQKDENDKYFTLLHAEITLYDASLNILEQLSEDVRDTPSYNKRKDFFLRGPFKVPTLKPGKYQVVISVEDKIAGKRALAARYNFVVKGDTAQASDTSTSDTSMSVN